MTFDKYITSSFSHEGRKKDNQDNILIKDLGDSRLLLAIADGMGGQTGGKIASSVAIESLKSFVDFNIEIRWNVIYDKIQKDLETYITEHPDLEKMGTTLTACLIDKDYVSFAHVGDTRLYHLRDNGIISITKDQTELQKLIDDKVITKSVAKNYPRKNILLSVMSARRPYTLQTGYFRIQNNDRLLLSTDGAYSLISKKELRDLSIKEPKLDLLCEKIKNTIEHKNIKDDYSVILFQLKNI
ncbi:protein phosphatase 2C domain-containing protein [uncultured Tolumonas sp.]|uniref:PP2C family protein-serine/threonine phosphatase n=1 Tax=uncultured Tolumonas sp. TaxID=263765 RepID=UPI002A0A3BB0|nr:protein phosphatase 2C domain-containing protein [uncultured Tolumonas sp.]